MELASIRMLKRAQGGGSPKYASFSAARVDIGGGIGLMMVMKHGRDARATGVTVWKHGRDARVTVWKRGQDARVTVGGRRNWA